ncbi:MAG TPA: response regulator, partial [Flavobacteriales bacterium]|nr:response regulator [Flavobacteriales bacterium]
DVNLPDGPGYSLIPLIKSRSPGAVCIAISAVDTEAENATAAGADTFVPKPLNRQAIFGSLRQLGFNI